MPTYDYLCEKGHRFEMFQSMKDEPIKTCLECGAGVKRLIGPGAGFLFRGDGFYITDYRSKTYQDKAKAEAGGSAPSESKAEKSPESTGKPAADKAGAAGKSSSEKPSAEKSSTAKPNAEKSSAKPASDKPSADKSSPRKKNDS